MPTTDSTAPTRVRLSRLLTIGLCIFWLPAHVSIAQSAIYSGAIANPLPLRNIQIEVRQLQRSNQERSGLAADGGIATDNRSSAAQQQVLVALGEWVTVAQSDQDSQSSRAGWSGQGAQSTQQSSELQVRLTVL